MNRAGYVLVGGRSSRMGRDKALLPFRGGLLAGRVAAAVAEAASEVYLVGDPQRHGRVGYPIIADCYPGEGPLGGILTALAHTQADWNLLVACDMPAVSGPFLRGLLEAAEVAGADALIPVGRSGRPEPLCAVYHKRSEVALARSFAGGVRKVMDAVEELAAVMPAVAEWWPFENVNTPEEWAAYGRE